MAEIFSKKLLFIGTRDSCAFVDKFRPFPVCAHCSQVTH